MCAKKKHQMPMLEFKQTEMLGLLEIFDFTANIPASIYLDTTAVKLPEACYRSALISQTHLLSEEYLLNQKRSTLDMGLIHGVFSYSSFGVRGSLSQRSLIEEEAHERKDNTIKLPPYNNLNMPLGSVIRSRRSIREMSEYRMSLKDLSTILFYGDGVTGEFQLASEEQDILPTNTLGSKYVGDLRTAPSGGGLYPVYLYIVIQNVENLDDGLYIYMPITHSLKKVRLFEDKDYQQLKTIVSWGFNLDCTKMNAIIFYVYSLYENSRKYCDMALTFALIEAGEIAENIHLTSTALNLASTDVGGYEKVPCEKFLEIDTFAKHLIHLTVIGC